MRGENMSAKRPWSRNRLESIVLLIVVMIMSFQLSSHFGGELPDFDEADLSLAPSQPGFLNRLAEKILHVRHIASIARPGRCARVYENSERFGARCS